MTGSLALTHQFHKDWTPHRLCQKDTRKLRNYCLQLMELKASTSQGPKHVILLVSGLFQNTNAWDLLPEKNISLARYIRDQFNAKVFVIHTRGIAGSDYVAQTNLDDLAIDDLNYAVSYINRIGLARPIIIGHSQGAIVAQAFAGGISRCGFRKNCFLPSVATARSHMIKGIGLIAGNSALTVDKKNSWLVP